MMKPLLGIAKGMRSETERGRGKEIDMRMTDGGGTTRMTGGGTTGKTGGGKT